METPLVETHFVTEGPPLVARVANLGAPVAGCVGTLSCPGVPLSLVPRWEESED